MNYTILTTKSVFAPDRNWDDESYGNALTAEQYATLESLGYKADECYTIRFDGTDAKTYEMTIDEAIQGLAIRDEVDLVRFDNGNVGFVAYYNDFRLSENCFEIL